MSKIENITEKIEIDAKNESEQIISDANKKAQDIIASAENEAKKEADFIVGEASKDAKIMVEKALSSAELKARDTVLKAKEEVVERVFSMATEKLENLPSDEYIKYLKNEISKINLKDDATLYVPKRYYDDVVKADLNIKVSDSDDVKSGFSILNGRVMYNNEFSSLLDAKKGDLELIVVEKLFG